MVKPYLSIKLKDPQNYYLEDEVIHCTGNLKLDKVLKDAILYISFKGRASSHSNGTRYHYETIFTTEKEVSITKFNNPSRLKKLMEFEFEVQVPNGVTIPSYRYLEGGDGGKIEYMIEATLETSGFLKRSVQATHIIQVPLVGNINVNEDGLDRTRESSIRWPKNEENANTCILSAWIPHQGCIRGKDVTVRVELKQPKRYSPAEYILFELVRQEIIASGRDSLPDMTKQLNDKIIQTDKIKLELDSDIGDHRLIGMSRVVAIPIPSNITPTIKSNAKVMRLDYKIRVTAKMPGIDSGKDKELSVNLPITIGTTGVSAIYDSGFESNMSMLNMENNNGSDSGHSISQGGRYSVGPGSFYGANAYGRPGPPPGPYNPPMAGPGGFLMPNYNNEYHQQQYTMYPPPMHNQFVINAQQLPYPPIDRSDRIEGMPMPSFNDPPYPPNNDPPYPPHNNISNEILSPGGILSEGSQSGFGYPPPAPGSPGPASRYGTPFGAADFSGPSSPLLYPPTNNRDKPTTNVSEDQTMDEITSAIADLSPTSSIKHKQQELAPPVVPSSLTGKPNTPTPPQTPGHPKSAGWYEDKKYTTVSCQATPLHTYDAPSALPNRQSVGWYEAKQYTAVSYTDSNNFEESDDAVPSTKPNTLKKHSLKMPFRIDPLDSLAISSYPPPMYKNNSTSTEQ
ncbi:hypothetical protein BDF21DRAFT_498262 [Thamnidium elegans]|uniref:Arrestin C-terminal-like domain-containing protein n=1 Tax=Thamnidium elegans TaxID=101142 RepID=A0A8H7VQ24_9FUNG|nr:hypothetical protein INT48_009896 [Thamnidium elegans]KAI8051724.1 hypothetical protein BDF21DRAFT_498262 [Thamnidium elegans]